MPAKSKVSRSVNKLYAARINLRGLYSKNPVVVFYNKDNDNYVDDLNGLEVEKNGLDFRNGFVTFASQSQDEVQAFINGASAMLKLLEELVKFRSIE